MKKSTITDEQIFALLDENKTNAEIARSLGVPQGNINARINKLKSKHETRIPKKHIGNGRGEINLESLPEIKTPITLPDSRPDSVADEVTPEPHDLDPFPFMPKEQVMFSGRLHTVRSVEVNKLVMHENCSLRRVTITLEEWNRDKNLVISTEKKQPIKTTGEAVVLKHRSDDEEPDDIKAPETIFEKVAIRNKADRKPATVNQDFEDLFPAQKQAAEGMATFENKSVEDLFNPDPVEVAIESAPNDSGPLHIDLEMDDSVDPVKLPREESDYVDPEWFDKPIPRKGTVERVIWDKAYQEICEIQQLRAMLQTALNLGDRLPVVYVDKYNRYVSKYSGEVGA